MLAAAACGGDDEETSPPTAAPAVAAPTATIAPAQPTTPPAPSPVPATAAPAQASTDFLVDIKNSIHTSFEVPVGTTVIWTNQDRVPHTTTSGAPGDETGVWGSDFLQPQDSFSFTFEQAGTFSYFCQVHPTTMQGTVTVTGAGVSSAAPTSAPATPASAAPTPTAVPAPTQAAPTAAPTSAPTATPPPPSATAPPPTATMAPSATPEPTSDSLSVDIVNFAHQDVTVAVGTTVTWTNKDQFSHTTTAGTPGNLTGEWDSGSIGGGGLFSFTFDQAGTFAYFCSIHPTMRATVTVSESGSASSSSGSGSGYLYP